MLDTLIKGGWVLWVIIALSFYGVGIIIERFIYFRNIKSDEDKLFQRVKTCLAKGHFDEALAICDTNLSPLSSVIKIGIEYRDYPEATQKDVLRDAASQEIPRLEKHISSLGTIAHIAPLLGLLGTVTGTMRAFGVLGSFGAVSDPTVLATGVAEALITTVGGIVVAVPAVVFYNFLVNKVNLILIKMENRINETVLMVNASKKVHVAATNGKGVGRVSGDEGVLR